MKKEEVRITLRLPEDLHQLIATQAADQERSLNGQIVFLLRQATKASEPKKSG